jgi:predicted NUDIX family NTP pyrophosphohydrolase
MKKSAGILVYRIRGRKHEFLLVHPGGPFYKNKDLNSWSIPKGEYENDEDPFEAARREFFEETGIEIYGDFIVLRDIKQNSGKIVKAWAVEADIDVSKILSNTFSLEWPPKSGMHQEFPEIDRAEWFLYEEAKNKILKGQIPLIDELNNTITASGKLG